MSSFVLIEIDTTPPIIDIYIPSYTTNELVNEITIESNEPLSKFQNIYIIDGNGERHDYTFEHMENAYTGFIKFSNFPIGIATIYARVKDEVDNISNLVSKSFYIRENLTILTLTIRDSQTSINIDDNATNIEINDNSRLVDISDENIKIYNNDKIRNINIADSNRGVKNE